MPDNNSTTLQLILSFTGGGVISAIITSLVSWIRSNESDKKERKIRRLQSQLENFYGPVYFLISQNDRLFTVNRTIHKAYREEYVGVKFSRDELTQKRLKEETSATLNFANQYISEVEKNNNKIFELLNKGYSYMDPDDVELFVAFYEDYIRHKIEIEAAEELKEEEKMPLSIYDRVGEISFMRPELIKKIKNKYDKKIKEINELMIQ